MMVRLAARHASRSCLLSSSQNRTLPRRLAAPPARRRAAALTAPKALAIPDKYGFVLASVATTGLVAQWLAFKVAFARREYGVAYPAMYAEGDSEGARRFNCVQRAHQNALETMPLVVTLEALLGLQYPIYAASLGMIWNVGRVIYALGYSTGDPKKRAPGFGVATIAYLALILSTLVTGVRLGAGI